jgi:hypothetical protein
MAPPTPQEVCEAVIDHVAEEWGAVPTLCACAIASRRMTARAQRHIFRSIRLTMDHDRLAALEFILDRHPGLISHVRDVYLIAGGQSLIPFRNLACATRVFAKIAPQANILFLMLQHRTLPRSADPVDSGTFTLDTAGFSRLAELQLSSCAFQTHSAHVNLLQALPTLRTLSIGAGVQCSQCTWDPWTTGPSTPLCPTLETIVLNSSALRCFCIVDGLATPGLKRLAVTGGGSDNITGHLMRRLVSASKRVDELDLTFGRSFFAVSTPAGPKREDGEIHRRHRVGARKPGGVQGETVLHLLHKAMDTLPSSVVHTLRVRLPPPAYLAGSVDWTCFGAWFGSRPAPMAQIVFVLEGADAEARARFAEAVIQGKIDERVEVTVE